ncbi:hypothetical protein DL768_005528 [Monosporascus sp. mg162]|nr:hypothetical protein DL768_005528 [Monosporascus sp. mg162]
MGHNANGYNGSEVDGDVPIVPGAFLRPNVEDSQILEAMDKLRDLKVDLQYDLPQIIVCGSQSAGKSSVLESIVGVPFPRSENTCTKYVTKVTIVPASSPSIQVRIRPSDDRPLGEIEDLEGFLRDDVSEDYATKLADFMSEANDLIFTGTTKNAMVTKDVLLITVSAPGNRPLQVLDLPGLIAFDQKDSGNDTTIETMVTEYMAMKQSMILAVIKANEDLNNQKILKLCKHYDQTGERTLGVITRPDVAEPAQLDSLIKVMEGKHEDFQFSHKWHVVRNRTSQELQDDISQAERDRREMAYLSQPPWDRVGKRCLGIVELRARLREMLFSVAKKELPSLCEKFRDKIGHLQEEFHALGGDEFEDKELESAFEWAITRLRNAARDHARGVYESDIGNSAYEGAVFLRARVADQSEVFRDRLVKDGHKWKTLVRPMPADPDSDLGSVYNPGVKSSSVPSPPKEIYGSLKSEIATTVQMLNQTRGTALPTFFDPKRIDILFWHMSEGWNTISKEHVENIYLCCKAYFENVTPIAFKRRSGSAGAGGFSDSKTVAERFVKPFIIPRLKECLVNALEELEKLEQDRLDFLINADKRFLKDRRSHRQGREFQRALRAYHELDLSLGTSRSSGIKTERLDQTTYAQHAGLHTQQELAEDTAETYLDSMWSHYLIDRDIYIANVLRQVIERHFLRHIEENIPKRLDSDKIKDLTRKDNREELRKNEIKKEIKVLESSLEALEGIR